MRMKHIIKIIIQLLIVTIIIGSGYKYYLYKVEKDRLAQPAYFTEYKLSGDEMTKLIRFFSVKSSPELKVWYNEDILKEEDWPDYTYFTIESTEDTKIVVEVMNYQLFDEKSKWNEEARKKVEGYGINENNRLTVEWVMKHPKEAIEIVIELNDIVGNYGDWQWVLSKYESITGIPMEKYEP